MAQGRVLKVSAMARPSLRKKKSVWQRYVEEVVTCCSGKSFSPFKARWNRPSGITFDEVVIEAHKDERGVVYGTQKIDEPETPFLLYDSQMSRAEHAVVEVGEGHVKTQVDIVDLQSRLGVVQRLQDQGIVVGQRKVNRYEAIEEENRKRREAGELLKGGGDSNAMNE